MIEVELPDGTIAEFPDGTSNDIIKGALQKRFPTPEPAVSVAEDIARVAPAGLARGTADLLGLPGTIGGALESGIDWAKAKGYELVTGETPTEGFWGPSNLPNPLSGASLRSVASKLTGGATDYQAQTTPGQYVGTTAEFLPAAATFGGASLPNLVKTGVIPALTSETAGQMTEGTVFEPYARVAGALLGGAAGSRIGNQPPTLPSAKDIKASAGYAQLEAPMKAAQLTSQTYKQIVSDLWNDAQNFGLTTQLKGEFGGTFRDFLKRAEASGGASLHDLELLRRSLRNAAGNKLDDASQALSGRLVERLDDAVENLSATNIAASGASGRPVVDALQEARGVYRTGMKAQMIEDAIQKAQTQASGVENGLRIQFRKIADNKKLMRGFSDVEQQAIRDVAKGTFTSNALRWLGTFGVPIDQGRNFLGSLSGGGIGATVGNAVAGPAGATIGGFALPAVGTVAKMGAQRATETQARIVEQLVKAGPQGSAQIVQSLAGQQAVGREAILRALLQSQSAGQVPMTREYAR